LKKNQRQEGFINTYPWPKKPGIFYICVPLKGANAQDVAAFCVTARGRQNCLWESIARGPALINNRGAARGWNGKAPPEEGALYKERVMMKFVIILVVLLLLSFPTY